MIDKIIEKKPDKGITDFDEMMKESKKEKIKDFFYAIVRPIKNKFSKNNKENTITTDELQNMLDNLPLGN